jgi:transposase
MPQNFLSCDREQSLLLPPDLREWLDEDHLAWFVIEAIEELELEPFYCAYRADGHGAAAHDPKMMLTLLAYAYCVGERSSRGIERRCREDVAFRVICANLAPDHATIARFRVRHQEALAELFAQVLGLCADAGLVRAGVLAVDGSKFAASASDSATRSYEEIAAEILAEADRIDEAEDEIHGEARGDELPEHLRTHGGRRAWLRDAKRRLDQERAARAEPVARDRAERLQGCHRRLVEEWRREQAANRAYGPTERVAAGASAARRSPTSHPPGPPARSTPPTPTRGE